MQCLKERKEETEVGEERGEGRREAYEEEKYQQTNKLSNFEVQILVLLNQTCSNVTTHPYP